MKEHVLKRVILILVAILMTVPVFATGQADTGRDRKSVV